MFVPADEKKECNAVIKLFSLYDICTWYLALGECDLVCECMCEVIGHVV